MGDRALLWPSYGLQTAQSEKGLDSADAMMVQRAAHALKDSVGTFQASAAQEGWAGILTQIASMDNRQLIEAVQNE